MARLDNLRAKMAEAGLEAYLITQPTNVAYMTGFSGSFGQAIVTESANVLITDSRYTIQAQEQAGGWDVRTFGAPVKGIDFLRDALSTVTGHRIAFEADYVTVAQLERWQEALPNVQLVSQASIVDKLRLVKDEGEIEKIRRACALADACFAYLLPKVQENVTENDLALEIDFYFRRQGATSAFSTIAVSGERSARPHGTPSDKRLAHGDFVTFDFGAKLDGYNSDITRTVVVGEASERHREVYGAVLKALEEAQSAMRPGLTGHQIDTVAREAMGPLAERFGHGLGHGLGLLVHDGGDMRQGSEMILEPGMVLTVEPGVYIEGFGGCRIEDDVVVRDSGVEVLTQSSRDLLIV